MRPVNVLKFTVGANQSYRLPAQGSSFKVLGATGLVLVKGDWGSIDQCSVGQGITGTDFSYLVFTDLSGAANTLRVIVGDAGFIDNITGNVGVTDNVMPTAGSISTTNVVVGVASAQILAANTSRAAFSFQNRSASSSVYLAFGTAATTAAGWQVGPGQSWEPPVVPTQAVFAIADAAATPGVVLAG